MRETDRQIKIYTEKLPRMKERVIAALTMLLLAVVMTVSSSMAWLVLSSDPEVKGMNTTITANGNLEIALASGTTITPPKDTAIGDGALPLLERNITWGNLVNLGDPVYGLEKIVLRPATLNRSALKDSPLYAAEYGSDGRVDILESKFAYVGYDSAQGVFIPNNVAYGVRAISSVKYGATDAQKQELVAIVNLSDEKMRNAKNQLQALADSPQIQKLLDIAAKYVEAQLEENLPLFGTGKEPPVFISVDELKAIAYLMNGLIENIEMSADALATMYNIQMFVNATSQYYSENYYTGEYLLTASLSDIETKFKEKDDDGKAYVVPYGTVALLQTLQKDYTSLKEDYVIVNDWAENNRNDIIYQTVAGYETNPTISGYINKIVDVSTTTIDGVPITGVNMDNYRNFTGSGKSIVINKGIFQRMDNFTGADVVTAEQLSLSVSYSIISANASGWVSTSATYPGVLDNEFAAATANTGNLKGNVEQAGDTFGMALDFFLRTNAPNAHLILQGSPVYETRQETATVNIGGTTYNLYNVTATVGEGEEATQVTQTAYRVENNDGTYTYYLYDREYNIAGSEIVPDEGTTPTLVVDEVEYIVGYSGVNRVWDEDDALLDETSTTQGAGSCYTFYASSPEDQEKSLQLLEHFRIAFVSESGQLLGSARLDTEKKFEQSGKVTVPLMLEVTNNSITAEDGTQIYTITELTRNEATFITALIYLDGKNLTNDQVLAAGEIQGQLNIQFGTTTDLEAMNDPVLKEEKCIVTATMDGNTTISVDDDLSTRIKTITVTVDGYDSTTVEAYFLREINATQGIRQEKITFTPIGDRKFEGTYTFTKPGNYILREVIVDGVTYELNNEPITLTVEGFKIDDVFCGDNGKTYMTTDKSFNTSVSLEITAGNPANLPTSVKGAFIHTGTKNRTTVYFTKQPNGTTWVGDATFTTSGEYKMEYLELDGEYTGLAENDFISINLYLGLTTRVYTGETTFVLENGASRNVVMTMDIRTDSGEIIGNLENVWLQYSRNGSSVIEQGVGASMVWNSRNKVYEGTFNIKESGTYEYMYSSVSIQQNENKFYTAVTSPVLTAVSTEIPEYVSKDGFGELFSIGTDAKFTITMKHADSATVDAILTSPDYPDTEFYVRGKNIGSDEQEMSFVLPIIDGKQSGTWTLEGIYMTNVFGGANNTFFNGIPTEGVPATGLERNEDGSLLDAYDYSVPANYYFKWWRWSLADLGVAEGEGKPAITIVSNINVAFTNSASNASKNFGKDTSGNVTGLFGQAYTLENLELSVTAGNNGSALSDYGLKVDSITLNYQYDKTELDKVNNEAYKNNYGNYTVAQGDFNNLIEGDDGKKVYSLASSSGNNYTIAPASSNNQLSVAGAYKATSLTVVVSDSNGKKTTVNAPVTNAPVYKVYSKSPTATVTGVSGSPSKQEKITWTQANNCSSNAPDFAVSTDNNSATAGVDTANNKAVLYGDATADNSTQHNGGFAQPTLTVTIDGISSDSTASFILPANGNATAVTFSRTGNGTISNKIGSVAQIKSWTTSLILTHKLQAYYGHGTQTIDQLTVTQGGATFTFTLAQPMTIVNPSSVNQL